MSGRDAARIAALEEKAEALAAEVARLADRIDGKDVHDEVVGPRDKLAGSPKRRHATETS